MANIELYWLKVMTQFYGQRQAIQTTGEGAVIFQAYFAGSKNIGPFGVNNYVKINAENQCNIFLSDTQVKPRDYAILIESSAFSCSEKKVLPILPI